MGKCSICGKKIQYNQFKRIDGVIYCPDCVDFAPKQEEINLRTNKAIYEAIGEPITIIIDEAKNVDFKELAETLAKVPGTIISGEVSDKDINNKIAEETKLEKKPKKRKKSGRKKTKR